MIQFYLIPFEHSTQFDFVWIYVQQDSSPAWTQEAYRPPCSKYSLCCPILADPPPPPHRLDLTPPPVGPDPPPRLDLTPPGWTWPPRLDLTPPGWTWPPQLAGPDPPCEQTDRHVSKHNLPVVLRTRAVIKLPSLILKSGEPVKKLCDYISNSTV